MNVHKNARMTRFGRLQLVHRIRQEGWTVAQAAEASSVSVRTAYKWLARYRAGGEPALCDRSSAPGHCPHRLAGETVAEIERLRRTRWTGPRISRATGVPLSTVGLVLRRLGLGRLRALDPRPPVIRYERKHPGEIIHIDTKKLGRINGPGHRMTGHRRGRKRGSGWEYLHVAIDDASRLAYTEVLASETGEACAGFMTRAARWFAACGVRIQRVMSDNAFAYTNSRLFKDALKAIGARHITTRPYTPRTNGKAERFIQTALREWLYAKSYNSSANRTADMPHWIHWYNLHRSHGGINASTPATRMNNLLGNDTARGHTAPSSASRCCLASVRKLLRAQPPRLSHRSPRAIRASSTSRATTGPCRPIAGAGWLWSIKIRGLSIRSMRRCRTTCGRVATARSACSWASPAAKCAPSHIAMSRGRRPFAPTVRSLSSTGRRAKSSVNSYFRRNLREQSMAIPNASLRRGRTPLFCAS